LPILGPLSFSSDEVCKKVMVMGFAQEKGIFAKENPFFTEMLS
jgi:hypothetical protein